MKIAIDAILKRELDFAYCSNEVAGAFTDRGRQAFYYLSLTEWEKSGLATRCLDAGGKVGWRPGPELLQKLNEMQAELDEEDENWGDKDDNDDDRSEGILLEGHGTFIMV